MKFRLPAVLFAGLAMVLASCNTVSSEFIPGPEDKLSEAETSALTMHARNFIIGSKRLKLGDAEREAVKNSKPELIVRYKAPKEGELSFMWKLSPERKLIVQLDGKFISEGRQDWAVQIVKSEKVQYINSSEPQAGKQK